MPIVLFLHPPPDPPSDDEENLLEMKEGEPTFAAGSELEAVYKVSLGDFSKKSVIYMPPKIKSKCLSAEIFSVARCLNKRRSLVYSNIY